MWLDTTGYCGTNLLGENEVHKKIVVVAGSKQGYSIRAALGVSGVWVSNIQAYGVCGALQQSVIAVHLTFTLC